MSATAKKFCPWVSPKMPTLIKMHGGKAYLARRILYQFPRRPIQTYIEPFMGGASVFLNMAMPGRLTVLSDTNLMRANLFQTMSRHGEEMQRKLVGINYDEETFLAAQHRVATRWSLPDSIASVEDRINAACDTMVVNRMSRGGLGKAFAWSDRLRGGQPGDLNAWVNCIAAMPRLIEAIRRATMILHGNGVHVIQTYYNHPDTVIYADPPYYPDTRTAKKAYGPDEMTPEQHEELAEVLNSCKGKVLLSGYDCEPYRNWFDANGWRRAFQIDMPNHAGQGKSKQRRVEVLWANY